MMDPSRFQITGPLKPHVEHVWTALLAQGYTPLSGANLVRLMAHLSRWLEGLGLQAYELTNPRVADFLVARQEAGYSNHLSRQGLEPILELLQTAGVVSALEEQEPEASERDRLFNDYAEYLVQERGVVPMTVLKYQSIARNFLSVCIGEDKLELSQLRASDVSGYIVRQSRQSSVNWTKYTVTALRSILHFLYLRGELATELDGAVGTVAKEQALARTAPRGTKPGRFHPDDSILAFLTNL